MLRYVGAAQVLNQDLGLLAVPDLHLLINPPIIDHISNSQVQNLKPPDRLVNPSFIQSINH